MARTGTALGSEHTLRYLYSPEVWKPGLALRQGLVGGTPGPETSLDRARAETKRLIDTHTVEPLPDAVQAEIDQILEAYRRSR